MLLTSRAGLAGPRRLLREYGAVRRWARSARGALRTSGWDVTAVTAVTSRMLGWERRAAESQRPCARYSRYSRYSRYTDSCVRRCGVCGDGAEEVLRTRLQMTTRRAWHVGPCTVVYSVGTREPRRAGGSSCEQREEGEARGERERLPKPQPRSPKLHLRERRVQLNSTGRSGVTHTVGTQNRDYAAN
jgi:hypothetical protein